MLWKQFKSMVHLKVDGLLYGDYFVAILLRKVDMILFHKRQSNQNKSENYAENTDWNNLQKEIQKKLYRKYDIEKHEK